MVIKTPVKLKTLLESFKNIYMEVSVDQMYFDHHSRVGKISCLPTVGVGAFLCCPTLSLLWTICLPPYAGRLFWKILIFLGIYCSSRLTEPVFFQFHRLIAMKL